MMHPSAITAVRQSAKPAHRTMVQSAMTAQGTDFIRCATEEERTDLSFSAKRFSWNGFFIVRVMWLQEMLVKQRHE